MFTDVSMVHVYPPESGINVCILTTNKNSSHDARIKVSNIAGKWSEDNFSMQVRTMKIVAGECKLDNKTLGLIYVWLTINQKTLLNLWDNPAPSRHDFVFKKVTKKAIQDTKRLLQSSLKGD